MKPSKILSMYCFNSFDDFCEFCTYLNNNNLIDFKKRLKNSCLYLYNSKYYLGLYNLTLSAQKIKALHCIITEFATFTNNAELFERKLIEYGKIIIKENAINTCIKHFN